MTELRQEAYRKRFQSDASANGTLVPGFTRIARVAQSRQEVPCKTN